MTVGIDLISTEGLRRRRGGRQVNPCQVGIDLISAEGLRLEHFIDLVSAAQDIVGIDLISTEGLRR